MTDAYDVFDGDARANRAGLRVIPRGAAIPPCLDAGWVAPELVFTHRELLTIPAAELAAFERIVALAGVEVSHDLLSDSIRVRHRRPSITTLDAS